MKQFKFLLFILLASIIIPSCSKDDNDSKSNTDLLTSAPWKYVDFKVAGMSLLEDCQRDDIITFSKDFNSVFNPGTMKCDPSEVIEAGTWSFSADEKSLIIDGDSATIASLTSTSLVLTQIESGFVVEISLQH
ncbi:MAG: lipocalin family protein [Saprospiraceae bacterium]|nr:lipocalin family protein [Saprospiraceae bacterium]